MKFYKCNCATNSIVNILDTNFAESIGVGYQIKRLA